MPSRKHMFLLAASTPMPAMAEMTFSTGQLVGFWFSFQWPVLVSLGCMALYFATLPGTFRQKARLIAAAGVTFLLFLFLGYGLVGEYAIAARALMPALVLLLLSAWYAPATRQAGRGMRKTVLRLVAVLALYLLALFALVWAGHGYILMVLLAIWPAMLAALVFAVYAAFAPVTGGHKAVMCALFVACGAAVATAASHYDESFPDMGWPMALAPTLAVLLYSAAYQRTQRARQA